MFPAVLLGLVALAGGPFRMDAFGRLGKISGRLFSGRVINLYVVVSLLLPLLLLGELITWSHPYLGYLRGRWGYSEAVAPLGEVHPLWDDNCRGADKNPNKFMLAMKPAINGYDPLYIERVHCVLQSPPNSRMTLLRSAVLAENHRGNLFLKRSFWLARQYVAGPLPDAESVFPSATTVFLAEVPAGFPVPEVSVEEVLGKSVSDDSMRVYVADESTIESFVTRSLGGAGELTLAIPEFDARPEHGVLTVQYQSTHSATIISYFREMPSRVLTSGNTHTVAPARVADKAVSFSMLDYKKLRVSIKSTLERLGAPFRFRETYIDYDLGDEEAHIARLSNAGLTRLR